MKWILVFCLIARCCFTFIFCFFKFVSACDWRRTCLSIRTRQLSAVYFLSIITFFEIAERSRNLTLRWRIRRYAAKFGSAQRETARTAHLSLAALLSLFIGKKARRLLTWIRFTSDSQRRFSRRSYIIHVKLMILLTSNAERRHRYFGKQILKIYYLTPTGMTCLNNHLNNNQNFEEFWTLVMLHSSPI